MALGFGFNKTKVLSSAEKFVQQGKLQNAIAEYEKVIKEDPKDLTVLNAIGDLYARVGQNDKASEYFKKVGEQYAQNGFTVKAIAVYKKLTRTSTASESVLRLAELYTQQGLFNDARTHYMQVADQLLKTGDNNQAAKVFQKILELDPENTTTQAKLADLYIKLGRKEEARNIYYSAAESLYARKAFDAADEALSRVLTLDPENSKALLLRGMLAADCGDSPAAIQYLDKVADLDSRPDALRALVHAKLQTGVSEGVEPLAVKLFTVHQDMSGLSALAEWQGSHHQEDAALTLYDKYAEKFFGPGAATLVGTLYPLISRIRENPPALERMLRLLQKAGDTSHLNEVVELLAHAKVQSGDFAEARDLYKELSESEPENPLHTQNYRQMLAKLGEDAMSRPLTMEESNQALMVEELEHSAPTIHQEYAPTVERAIEAALTDAELFISYNVPLKAIAPLETVLPVAPRDLRLNQRLASLYLRAGRYGDAVKTCKLLSEIYAEFGHQAEADRYAEEARKYSPRATGEQVAAARRAALAPQVEREPMPAAIPAPPAHTAEPAAASTVQEFVLDVPEQFFEETAAEPVRALEDEAPSSEATVREFQIEALADSPAESATPVAPPQEVEIDVSHEWEDMLTVEPEATVQATPEVVAAPPEPVIPMAPVAELAVDTPPEPIFQAPEPAIPPPVAAPVAQVSAPVVAPEPVMPVQPAIQAPEPVIAAPEPVVPTPEPVVTPPAPVTPVVQAPEPVPLPQPIAPPERVVASERAVPPERAVPAAKTVVEVPEPAAPTVPQAVVEAPAPIAAAPVVPPHAPAAPVVQIPEPVAVPEPVAPPPEEPVIAAGPDPAAIEDKVQEIRFYISQGFWDMARAATHDLSEMAPGNAVLTELNLAISIGEAEAAAEAAKAPKAPPVSIAAPVLPVAPPAPPPVEVHPSEDDFVLELEDDLLPPVVKPPAIKPEAPAPVIAAKPAAEPVQASKPGEDILGELVSDLEESLGDFIPGGATHSEPVPPATNPVLEPPAIITSAAAQAAASVATNGGMHDSEATSVLSNILSELQQDLGEDTVEAEDPETHYNLGIAFKEMGLLDEAIGELQKVCHAVEVGNSFSQPVQAYTWLAQCLVDKGVPEAAVRWYQKALQLPGLDHSSRCAIYYDLGSAYEASGDKKSALANFMEAYSSNIDFRDVASRIKVLKA